MIPNTNKLNIWTIIANALIIIAARHSIAVISFIEMVLVLVRERPLYFSLYESYDNLLFTAALFSLIGQVVLVISMLMDGYVELIFKIIGVLSLYVGLVYLGVNCLRDSISAWSLFCSIPFVVLSIKLLVRQFRLVRSKDVLIS